MSDDLVKRLMQEARLDNGYTADLSLEAANRIAALEGEVADRKAFAAGLEQACSDLRAEVARLKRDVVRPLVEAVGIMSPMNVAPSVLKAWEDGRAALAGEER